MSAVNITIQPTPNPNALKFILDQVVKAEGKSTYRTLDECHHNPLATELFQLRGVDQIYMFENTITITKFSYEEWDELETKIIDTIHENIGPHNPRYEDPNPEAERRAGLPAEILAIEEILDKTIRPGLQADGGDLECVSYHDNVLVIKYQGACGTCPSSTTGTLQAITGILRAEHNPEIEVYAAPEW